MQPVPFSQRLKALREEEGWTQRELAERAGFSQPFIARLESGTQQPSWDTVCRLADTLKINLDNFRNCTCN